MPTEDQVLLEAQTYWENVDRQCQMIAANTDLTIDARNRQVDELRSAAEPKLSEFQRRHKEATASDQYAALRRAVKPPSGDPARMASYREALDRATKALKEDRLADLLEEAEVVGDEDQATAVYTVALRDGNLDVAEAYIRDRPARRAAFDAFMAQTRNGRSYGFFASMYFGLPAKPVFA